MAGAPDNRRWSKTVVDLPRRCFLKRVSPCAEGDERTNQSLSSLNFGLTPIWWLPRPAGQCASNQVSITLMWSPLSFTWSPSVAVTVQAPVFCSFNFLPDCAAAHTVSRPLTA